MDASRALVPLPMAWCLLQARLDGGRQQWRPVLVAVTEKDLLLYDGMPWTRDAWASPCHSYPLVATRWAWCAGTQGVPSTGSSWQRPVPHRAGAGTEPETVMGVGWHGAGVLMLPLHP